MDGYLQTSKVLGKALFKCKNSSLYSLQSPAKSIHAFQSFLIPKHGWINQCIFRQAKADARNVLEAMNRLESRLEGLAASRTVSGPWLPEAQSPNANRGAAAEEDGKQLGCSGLGQTLRGMDTRLEKIAQKVDVVYISQYDVSNLFHRKLKPESL